VSDILDSLSPALPFAAILVGALLVGFLALLLWQRHIAAGGDAPRVAEVARPVPDSGDGGETPPGDAAGQEGERAAMAAAMLATAHLTTAAWTAHTVWARSGLVLEPWGGQTVIPRGQSGRPAPEGAAGHPMDLYVWGEAAHARAVADLGPEFGAALGGKADVITQAAGLAVIRARQMGTAMGQETQGASLWRAGLRARTALAPLGWTPGDPVTVVYGEVQRGLLVASAREETRAQASAALLAATVGLLSSLPQGSVELFLAAHPLSVLSSLSTAPVLAGAPTPPDRTDLLGALLDRVMADDRPEELRRLRVVVLDHALAALATSPTLCARLETALAQGRGRGLVVLASTIITPSQPQSTLSAFACRLLLGPCADGDDTLERVVPGGVTLPALQREEAVWVDRRVGMGSLCQPWSMDGQGAAAILGLAPAALDLAGATSDRPRPGQTLLVVRLLGALTVTTPDGQTLTPPGGLTPRGAELLAFLATRWGQCLSSDDLPLALHAVTQPTREALATALAGEGGGPRASVFADGQADRIGLLPEAVWVDSVAFAALCRLADTTPGAGDRLTLLERALALYQGDFLGQATPPWAAGDRARLRLMLYEALRAAADLASAAGHHQQALGYADRLIRAVVMEDESATCLSLRAYGAAGNRAGVEEVFAAHGAALAATDLGPPTAAVSALYRELTRGPAVEDQAAPAPALLARPAGRPARRFTR